MALDGHTLHSNAFDDIYQKSSLHPSHKTYNDKSFFQYK